MTWTGGAWTTRPSGRISGFAYDTRLLRKGEGFVALKTEKRDGHDYLESARNGGASMALVERPVPESSLPQLVVPNSLRALQVLATRYRQTWEVPVLAITGSCGKTSTKDLLKGLLGFRETHATEGNLNNALGVPVTLLRAEPGKHRRIVVEAGMNQPGEIAALEAIIQPDIAMVTMVGPAHLEKVGSLEAIAREKASLLDGKRSFGSRYFPESCLKYEAFQSLLGESILIRPADSKRKWPEAKRVYEYALDMEPGGGSSLALRTQQGPVLLFSLPFCSPGQAQNAALAVSVALDQEVEPEAIRERFRVWKPSRNRGEKLRAGDQYFFADCYNANPASVEDALVAFREGFDASRRRLYVLGSMNELGAEASAFHRDIGRQIHLRPGDLAFFIGDYAEDFLEGFKENDPVPGSYQLFSKTGDALTGVEHFTGAILLKGSRSYRLEQLIPDSATPIHQPEELPC